ncbi:MAG: spore coat protein CotJB [Ethanoligenens sp.]
MNEQMTLLQNIAAIDFAMQELRLFLDTHPADTTGIALFNKYQQKHSALVKEYTRSYGPLDWNTPNTGNTWQWVKNPWPWEAMANPEV